MTVWILFVSLVKMIFTINVCKIWLSFCLFENMYAKDTDPFVYLK